jgi:hypothetical protein
VHAVLLLTPIILFMCTILRLILSSEFNSISAVPMSVFPKWRTKSSSGDAAQASARLTMSPHSPFILAHDISHGQHQLSVTVHGHVSSSLRV